MDTSVQNQSASQAKANSPFGFLPTVLLLVGLILGLVAGLFLPFNKAKAPQVSESELPVSAALLKNPIINQWRGSAEGKVIAKDSASLTIQDDKGNSLVIPFAENPVTKKTGTFFDSVAAATDSSKPAPFITLDDIPLGSYVRGDFFVVPGSGDQIFGNTFDKFKNPQ